MRTYIYTENRSDVRGMNKRITVYRIKRNQPHLVGSSDHHTAAWYGAHGQAVAIIQEKDGLPAARDHYELRGELGPAHKYDPKNPPRNAVRLFGV